MKVRMSLDAQVKLGKLVYEARKRSKVTQKELGLLIGSSNSQYISNAERGVSSLSLEAYNIICCALKIDPKILSDLIKEDLCQQIDRALLPKKDSSKKAA